MTDLQCEIRVKGRLGPEWSEWFDGLAIRQEDACTLLCGSVPDQSALYGLLIKLRDLGLALLSVRTSALADQG